jgi:hypothetical protein
MMRLTFKHKHKQKHVLKLKEDLELNVKVSDLAMLEDQELEELTFQELAKNPEIELSEETGLAETVVKEDPLGLDPGFMEAADEFEDGERIDFEDEPLDLALALEKAAEEHYGEDENSLAVALDAIDEYASTGRMPDEVDNWLRDTLVKLRKEYLGLSSERKIYSTRPTFRVDVRDGKVVAVVTRSIVDLVRARSGVGKLSKGTQAFFQKRQERMLILNALATHVLEDIQADFFLRSDLRSALLALIPLPITSLFGKPPGSRKLLEYRKPLESVVAKLEADSRGRLSKSRLVRLGQLSVSSQLGVFPLVLFWPQKAALLRVWLQAADAAGSHNAKAMRIWLLKALQERASALSGRRLDLFKPLLSLNEDDIENALKARNRGHRRP